MCTVPAPDTAFSDNFSSEDLHPRWVVPGGEPDSLVERRGDGGISFRAWGDTDLLCHRVEDFTWRAEAVVEDAGEFRLRLDERHWCRLRLADGRVAAELRIGDAQHEVASLEVPSGTVTLRIAASPPRTPPLPVGYAGPDDITLSVGTAEGFKELARLDGRYYSTEVASGFTGRMLGLGAPGPAGRVLRVSYQPLD